MTGGALLVPEGVPHVFDQIEKELVMITMKVPRTHPQ